MDELMVGRSQLNLAEIQECVDKNGQRHRRERPPPNGRLRTGSRVLPSQARVQVESENGPKVNNHKNLKLLF